MSSMKHTPAEALENVEAPGRILTTNAARALAVLRICTGVVFLWAFFDKAFGWGYATPGARAWVNGGSPTKGFLSSVDVGPFQSMFHSMAGTWWADWSFMLGLLAIGVAVTLGVGMRIAAGAGALMMAMMWLAEFPPAQHNAAGAPSMSTNPLLDYHFIYAVTLVVLAVTYAGYTWGLGRRWTTLPLVRHHHWLV